ncbi:MAG TPA: TonB family protein [Burkholderiaceae bacterium]|jgi:TonB family protein|nr:TonB family protein [Burkholderiaceae bacterium]
MGILTSTVAESVTRPALGGALVYRKSSRGVVKLAAIDGGQLSSLERHLLIMVDGRRTLAELAELFGSEKLKLLSLLAELEAKGLVKRVDPKLAADSTGAITQVSATLLEAPSASGTRDRTPPRDAARARDPRPAYDAPAARFFPPAVITPRREPAPAGPFSVDEHPLAWFFLVLMLTIAGSNWLAHRFRTESSHTWWNDYQQAPTDPFSRPMPAGDAGGRPSDGPSPIRAAPGSGLATASPAVRVPHVAPEAPAHPASRVAPQRHPTKTLKVPVVAREAPAAPPGVAQTPAAQPVTPAATAPETANAPSDTEVASAQAVEQSSTSTALRPLRQDPPRIPAKAVHDGIVEGHAQVRLWITPEGKVDQVDVLEASPPGVLDEEVKRALSLWTFEPPGHPVDEVVRVTLEP